MIDFFLDNFVWFLLPPILLQVFVWLASKIKSRVASPANPPGESEGKVGITLKRIWQTFWGALKKVIWGPKNRDSDKFWKKKAYPIIRVFGITGTVILFLLVVLPPLLRGTLGNEDISEKEIVRNAYYLLIFIGAGLAASIATWRGRQSERQIRQFERQMQNSRFEKAVDMATDPGSLARRGSGFLILKQMFFTSRENFDDLMEKNIDILEYISVDNFKMKEKRLDLFRKLYSNIKISYSEETKQQEWMLHEMTREPAMNTAALDLWKGIMNKKVMNKGRRQFNNDTVSGIYAPEVNPGVFYFFIFSEMNLNDIQFFVIFNSGKIDLPDEKIYANFQASCFISVNMQGAIVNYVDFSKSHFSEINYKEEKKKNCKMSCIGTIFNEANLIDCNFRGADFRNASFVKTTTLRTIFDEASLIDCDFRGTNFEGASFLGTDITGSDFSQAYNLMRNQFEQGAYWIRPTDSQFLEGSRPKFPRDDPNNFPDGFTDEFIESLARDAQSEEEKGQG